MERGFVKLWRKIMDSGLIQNAELFRFAAWAMMKATHKPYKHLVGNTMIDLSPGQFVMGRDAAAKELKTTPRKIRTCLVTLEKLEYLTIKATNKYSVITLLNWGTYQNSDPQGDQHSDQQATSKRPASDHKQEHKNKRTKEVESIPPTMTDLIAHCKTKGYTFDPEGFYHHHNTRGWLLSNKQKMKSWKSALVTWAKNDIKFNGPSGQPRNNL